MLADYMGQSEFEINGDTIRFDSHGTLIDGQHRLAAIVASNEGQVLLVVEGLDPTVFGTIDQGKPRTVANIIASTGVTLSNASNVIASAIIVMTGDELPTDRLSVAEYVVAQRDRFEPLASWAKRISTASPNLPGGAWRKGQGSTHILSPSPLAAIVEFMSRTADLEDVTEFFELIAGETATTDVITALNANTMRKRLIRDPLVRTGGTQLSSLFSVFDMIINTYNKSVAGEQVSVIKQRAKTFRNFGDLPRAHKRTARAATG
jgi:hypothetical protein